MGTYNQSGEEIVDNLEQWLIEQSGEGDIQAEAIAEAYNMLSKKQGWEDRLQAEDKENEYGDAIAVSLFAGMIGVLSDEVGKKITDVDKINRIIPLMNEACRIYKSMEDVVDA